MLPRFLAIQSTVKKLIPLLLLNNQSTTISSCSCFVATTTWPAHTTVPDAAAKGVVQEDAFWQYVLLAQVWECAEGHLQHKLQISYIAGPHLQQVSSIIQQYVNEQLKLVEESLADIAINVEHLEKTNEDGNEGVEANSSTEAGAHDGEEKFDPSKVLEQLKALKSLRNMQKAHCWKPRKNWMVAWPLTWILQLTMAS